ncbi:MAG: anthranilate synthase component II [Idiomarina sp.]|nr:anthranilate synthase component II [Idiomarina sp.]
MGKGRIFMLDNQDSFAYNLVDELAQLGFALDVYRNQVSASTIFTHMQQAAEHEPVMLCLSPGPGHPSQAGCLIELLTLCKGKFPILGICLGFQALIHQADGQVGRCAQVMHGKTSAMTLKNHPIFYPDATTPRLPNPLRIARYHSLQGLDVPADIEIIGDVDGIPMVGYDAANVCLGFQFHPESVMTTHGTQLLQQSVEFLLTQGAQLTCNH